MPSFISHAEGTNTASLGTHAAGDLIIGFAFRDGSNTAPTVPGSQNWTTVGTGGANTCSSALVWKLATSSAETVGTFTNATRVEFAVWRGFLKPGAFLRSNGASSTVSYGGITLQKANGKSWIAGFAGHRSIDTTLETPPTGMTNRGDAVDANAETAVHDTNAGVSVWTTQTVSVGGTSSGWESWVIELIARPTIADWLTTTLPAVAAATQRASLLCVGDSLTMGAASTGSGVGNNARSQSYPAQLAAAFTAAPAHNDCWLGDNGVSDASGTPHAYDSRLTAGTGWVPATAALGVPNTISGHTYEQNGGATTAFAFAPGVSCDRIRVGFATNAGSPQYTVNVDGGASLGTLPMTAPDDLATDTLSATAGVHTINVVATADSGFIYFVECWTNAAPKIQIFNAGWWGSTSGDWNDNTTVFSVIPGIQMMTPDLTVIMLGKNDSLSGVTQSTFMTNMRVIMDTCLATGPIVLVAPPLSSAPITGVSEATQLTYEGYMSSLATERGCPFVSITSRANWDTFAHANTAGFMDADGIHCTGTGYADIVSAIRGVIDLGAALAGSATAGAAATAALATAIKAAGAPSVASTATGALTTGIPLGGAASATATATGTLASNPPAALAGAASVAASVAAGLSTGIALAGAGAVTSTATGVLTNWASVTLAAPLYNGVGGILDPNFWVGSVPIVGTVVFYDPTHITIATNGEISADTNNCQAVVQFFDGTSWWLGLVVITPLMVGYANVDAVVQGALTTAIKMAAAASALVATVGGLTTAIQMAGTAAAVASATAALTTQIKLAGAVVTNAAATAALTTSQTGSDAVSTSAATGALTTAIKLLAAAASVLSAAGALSTQIALTAAAVSPTSASGSLTTQPAGLSGAASDPTVASASLTTQIRLAGAANELVAAAAGLSTLIQLAVDAAVSSSSSGSLLASSPIQGSAVSIASATAALSTVISLSGLAWTTSVVQAGLLTSVTFSGEAGISAKSMAMLRTIPLVVPPDSFADIRIVRSDQIGAQRHHGDLPFAEFYQALGEKIWYAIDWSGWLANAWRADGSVFVGQSIRPRVPNGYQATCVATGRTGGFEPTWIPYPGAINRDGSAAWVTSPIDETSLRGAIVTSSWQSGSAIELSNGGVVDEMTLVLIDTTNAVLGVDYDVQCTATISDLETNVGRVRVKVR